MSSGLLGLTHPENIVELMAPWLTDPVCLWVQQHVEELTWYIKRGSGRPGVPWRERRKSRDHLQDDFLSVKGVEIKVEMYFNKD